MMKPINPYRTCAIAGLVLALALILAADAFACPSCKDGLASDPNGAQLAQGIEASIIFMLSMPFLVFTGLCSYFYWEIRKAQKALERKQALEAASALDEPLSEVEQPEEELVGSL